MLAALALGAAGCAGGCAAIVGSVTSGLASDLSAAILEADDPAVVRDAAPAYLVMLDALLRDGDRNADLLRAAATLNGAYATVFVTDEARRRAFAAKAFELAGRAACLDVKWLCMVRTLSFADLERLVGGLAEGDVPAAYGLATAWAIWIQTHADDWNAIADLGRVKPIMARVAELAPEHDNGTPHIYLGVFETLLPPALGGKPELGRKHFERALAVSDGRHLYGKVVFAESYARLVFDRELHDRLLEEVLAAEPKAPGLTLTNTIAQERAHGLLASADGYF